MKNSSLILFSVLLLRTDKVRQEEATSIKDFLTDIKENKPSFRVIYARHLDLMAKPDSFPPGLENLLESILSEMSACMNAHQVDPTSLLITPYNSLELNRKTMVLSKEMAARTYLVSDGKGFNKYFLLGKDSKIQSWVRIKDEKVFLMF